MERRKQIIVGCCIGLYGISMYIIGYITGNQTEQLDNEIKRLEETKKNLDKLKGDFGL